MKEFNCIRCGECCKRLAISVGFYDIKRWHKEERWDILSQVSFCEDAPQGDGFYFHVTIRVPKGAPLVKQPCPFLKKDALCAIHKTKPMVCEDFPHGMQASNIPFCLPYEESGASKNMKVKKKVQGKQNRDARFIVRHFKELMQIISDARKRN